MSMLSRCLVLIVLTSCVAAANPICCEAMTAACESCKLQITIAEFCIKCTKGMNSIACDTCETKGQTTCQAESFFGAQSGKIGAFVPQCESDGSYKSMQCHGSTGYCWCVKKDGTKIPGTTSPPGVVPNCAVSQMTDCQLQAYSVAPSTQKVGQFIPTCLEDGTYSPLQCHGSTGYCWCVDTATGNKVPGTESAPGKPLPNCETKTPCQQQLLDATTAGLLGAFVPSCESDGSYSPKQCHPSTGYCWCVDEDGNKIDGTESAPGKPTVNCAFYQLSDCQQEVMLALATPMIGGFVPSCEEDGSYSTVQCHGSTGYCWCVDAQGHKVEGTEVAPGHGQIDCSANALTACQYEVLTATGLIGAFVPQCESDGSYKTQQCHPSTGYCWCVKSDGSKIAGTVTAPGNLASLDCSNFMDLTKCEEMSLAASSSLVLGVFTPHCEEDGSFSSMQCHGSTGICWCVDEEGHEIDGSSKLPGTGAPDCDFYKMSECEQLAATNNGLIGAYVPQCEEDGSYSTKQCHGSTGTCWCVDENGKQIEASVTGPGKELDCAVFSMTACEKLVYLASKSPVPGAFIPTCDEDGKFAAKQCHPSTGYCWCIETDGTTIEESMTKPGQSLECTFPLTPCQLQLQQSTGLLGAYKPQCEADGSYSTIQCHGSTGFCWCVGEDGEEVKGTRVGPGKQPDCSAVSSEPTYNCMASGTWSAVQIVWCCQHVGIGCKP
jgi:hypothetical protein